MPSLIELLGDNPDTVRTPLKVEIDRSNETGMDRLRAMFSTDKYGNYSKECLMITQYTTMSFLGGFAIGAISKTRTTFVDFIKNNEATKFQSHLDAKRRLQREIFLAFTKGGFHWGWRVGMFTLTFTSLMTTVSVYRGKESVLEYALAGGITGGIFKINMGLRGMFVGSLLGSGLGALTGAIIVSVLKIGGTSMEEMRQFSEHLYMARQSKLQENMKEYMIKEQTDLEGRKGNDSLFTNVSADVDTK